MSPSRTIHLAILCALLLAGSAAAQTPVPNAEPAKAMTRVFVTDSMSWEVSGGFGASGATASGGASGGARPQTAEIIKTFGERCPELTVTMKQDKADFIVLLDHEGGKGVVRKDNKIAIFDKEGDSIFSGSTRSLGNAVKDACTAIQKHLAERGAAK